MNTVNHKDTVFIPLNSFTARFLLQVRSLRLRLQKTERIGEAHYNITSVQNDHSEIVLSSGQICLDLLQTQNTGSHKGTINKFVSFSLSPRKCCKRSIDWRKRVAKSPLAERKLYGHCYFSVNYYIDIGHAFLSFTCYTTISI